MVEKHLHKLKIQRICNSSCKENNLGPGTGGRRVAPSPVPRPLFVAVSRPPTRFRGRPPSPDLQADDARLSPVVWAFGPFYRTQNFFALRAHLPTSQLSHNASSFTCRLRLMQVKSGQDTDMLLSSSILNLGGNRSDSRALYLHIPIYFVDVLEVGPIDDDVLHLQIRSSTKLCALRALKLR